MKAKIEITMDNAAFEEPNGSELARILRSLAYDVASEHIQEGTGCGLRDINGNKVGTFEVRK